MALLEEAGATELSLREAARSAGVSAMAPYRHFKDKAALLDAIATRGFELLADLLEAADRAANPVEALAAQGAAYVGFARRHPALFELMFVRVKPPSGGDFERTGGRAFKTLAGRVATLGSRVPEADLVVMSWSFVHGLAALILSKRLDDRPDETDRLVERVTHAFAALVGHAA